MDHEVQVITGAYTGVIRDPDQLSLSYGRAHNAQWSRHAILSQVHIELVGGGAGGGVFQDDKIGVGFIPVRVCPDDTLNRPTLGSQHIEHPTRITGLAKSKAK